MSEEKELTQGQKLCGVNFNPTQDPLIADIKQRYADIADMLIAEAEKSESTGKQHVITLAINELVTAQMWAIKAVTWTH